MTADELCTLPATTLARAVRAKEVSPVEVVDAVLARIERLNPTLNAYCTVTADAARSAARAAERAVLDGTPLGPLHGVPFGVKDLVITKGVRTTRGSYLHADDVPAEDAPSVERLKAAGAILIGKTTTPEFGGRGDTSSPLLGVTRNPWRLDLTAGGSSGGAAVAAAVGLGPLQIGTDGAGSIRIPASFCGIFGLKPSYGRVPTYPASPTWPLSHVGPMTRTVRDAALMLRVMAGPDDRDVFSLDAPPEDYLAACERGVRGLRVAWSPDLGYATVDAEVRACAEAAARRFADLGCAVEEVDPGWEDPARPLLVLFCAGIASAVAEHLETWRDRLDEATVRIAEYGLSLRAIDLAQAHVARHAFGAAVRRLFERYDLLLTPTLACRPFAAGLERPQEIAGQPLAHAAAWIPFTYPFNLTGQPAASVPCGFTSDGMPAGLQIVGRRFADATVLRAAAAYEALAPWHDRWPPVVG
jgi:aspartyl-tRNA(Asn)/glutamyl-tRNA(Gln) amidotransferase subunit A